MIMSKHTMFCFKIKEGLLPDKEEKVTAEDISRLNF